MKRAAVVGCALAVAVMVPVVVRASFAPETPIKAGAVRAVKVMRQEVDSIATSTTFARVPTATMKVRLPEGPSLITVRFSGESKCTGGRQGAACPVRVTISGAEADPQSGGDFAFDSVGTDGRESHSLERSAVRVGPAAVRVAVQYKVTDPDSRFVLDDWHLTVERSAPVQQN
jgi:hypothetical protein